MRYVFVLGHREYGPLAQEIAFDHLYKALTHAEGMGLVMEDEIEDFDFGRGWSSSDGEWVIRPVLCGDDSGGVSLDILVQEARANAEFAGETVFVANKALALIGHTI